MLPTRYIKYGILLIILLLLDPMVEAQEFSPRRFVNGYYTDLNDAVHKGLLKYSVNDPSKVRYKKAEDAKVKKFGPQDIKHFSNDLSDVYSLSDVEVISNMSRTKRLKKCFGVLLEEGEIMAYMVYFEMSLTGETGSNVVLRRYKEGDLLEVSFPVEKRISDKKAMEVRSKLLELLGADDAIKAELMDLDGKKKGFSAVLPMVKKFNAGNK